MMKLPLFTWLRTAEKVIGDANSHREDSFAPGINPSLGCSCDCDPDGTGCEVRCPGQPPRPVPNC
jgi:hypothetical protein